VVPIYEYRCQACGKVFEYQQKMSEPRKEVCEECGGKLEKLISQSSFALKGGGWYSDLYSSPKPEKPEKKEAKSESKAVAGKGTGESKSSGESKSPSASKDASASKKGDK
jgi:putative FmdB family regulatory protein